MKAGGLSFVRERTGIQRYRCLPCARTFNDLTRTVVLSGTSNAGALTAL